MDWIPAAAAAAVLRRSEQEEEDSTRYSLQEISEGWEFKIVRSDWPVFRKPDRLRQLIEEEGRAGWLMLEKLDDSRVRFKRPRSARHQDPFLPPGVDPYRAQIAGGTRAALVIGLAGVLALLAVGLLVLMLVVRGG